MKKIVVSFAVAVLCAGAWAEEDKAADAAAETEAKASSAQEEAHVVHVEKASWPVWIAFNSHKELDVIGLRLTLPYGSCEGVTGFDLGLFGRCRYMEGVQINLLRNDALDTLAGFQVGLYNSVGRGDLWGMQVGLWNEAHSLTGLQIGIVNVADSVNGVQIGLINRAETIYGFQVGGVNVIRESEMPFCPIVNVGLDSFSEL